MDTRNIHTARHALVRDRVLGHLLAAALVAVGAGATVGCGDPGATGAGINALVEVSPDTEPLEPAANDWSSAPAGCEGQLSTGVRFRMASGPDGLVAAVDIEGVIVCVDSVESVQDELSETGRAQEAEDLGERFLLTLGLAIPNRTALAAGDPSPQPSMAAGDPGDSDGFRQADPSPQPSSQP